MVLNLSDLIVYTILDLNLKGTGISCTARSSHVTLHVFYRSLWNERTFPSSFWKAIKCWNLCRHFDFLYPGEVTPNGRENISRNFRHGPYNMVIIGKTETPTISVLCFSPNHLFNQQFIRDIYMSICDISSFARKWSATNLLEAMATLFMSPSWALANAQRRGTRYRSLWRSSTLGCAVMGWCWLEVNCGWVVLMWTLKIRCKLWNSLFFVNEKIGRNNLINLSLGHIFSF